MAITALTEALATDEHLGPFLAIPGKDNSFDIEGLAIAGDRASFSRSARVSI